MSRTLPLLALLVLCDVLAGDTADQEVSHQVQVSHPGVSETDAAPQRLIQRLDKNGRPVDYYLDTQSVFCIDGMCKSVTVRIFWNELGLYERYELASGSELEKSEGKPFSKQDHGKLHQILSDRNSALKDVDFSDMKHHENADSEVDGISSATPPLYQSAAVEGAAWTSFTLWHWANGDLSRIIHELTAAACTLNDLRDYLKRGDTNHKAFALEQLIGRKAYDQPSLDAVTRQIAREGRALTKLALQYFEQTRADVYFGSMEQLFDGGNTSQRVMVLHAMLTTMHQPPPGFMDQFSRQLAGSTSYQEVDLLLRLMESRNPSSPKVVLQATGLLANENFLIARRAYWFLRKRSVGAAQQEKLEAFRLQYSDRL